MITPVAWANRQPGDVGVIRHSGIISDLIVDGERAAGECQGGFEASHAIVIANDDRVLEAISPKVCLTPCRAYDGVPSAIFRISVDAALKESALFKTITEYVGKGYDFVGTAIGMAALELFRALHLPAENNRFAQDQKVFCSELVTDFILELMPDPENPVATDPQQVYNFLSGKAIKLGYAPTGRL